MKQHVIIPNFLSPSEADALIGHAKEAKSEYRTHRGGDAYCTVAWINHDHPGFQALTDSLTSVVNFHNANRFRVPDLEPMCSQYQYTDYHEPGDAYGWHADSGPSADYLARRRLTITVSLSDSNEYTGGGFELSDHCGHSQDPNPGNVYSSMLSLEHEEQELLGRKGTLIIFPSNRIHRALPLASGSRKVLVGWISSIPLVEQSEQT